MREQSFERRLAPHVGLMFLFVALAGCVENDGAGDDSAAEAAPGSGAAAANDVPEPGAVLDGSVVPTWSLGDYWVFGTNDGATNTFVVTATSGADYVVDTDSENFAFANELDDISTLGPQRKDDLAGSQGSDRVEFFRFPLELGASWTTMWDGQRRVVTVVEEAGGEWGLEAVSEDGSPFASYGFDAEAGWFSSLGFYDEDGSLGFESVLDDWGSGYTGQALRYDVEEVFARTESDAAADGAPDVTLAQFTQSNEDAEVMLIFGATCTAGTLFFSVIPEDSAGGNPGFSENDPCPKEPRFFGSLGSQTGDWGITVAKATDPDAVWWANVFVRTPIWIDAG